MTGFGDIDIDETRFELRRAGQVVPVEPRVFDLIRFLAANPNRLITKDDLIAEVWQGRIVSDATLSTAIKSARRALGDDDAATSRIRTVRGRGFRLDIDTDGEAPAAQAAARLYVQPSFVVLSPNGVAAWQADRIQRSLSHAMARVPFVTVTAPTLAQRVAGGTAGDLARAFGPGFALDITGRDTGPGLVLDCLVFDTGSGATIWSHRTVPFDPESALDEALNDIAVRLQPQLVRAIHAALSGAGGAEDPRALTLRALGTMSLRGWNIGAFAEAEDTLRRALSLDDRLSSAHAALALILGLGPAIGLARQSEKRRAAAIRHAERALELDSLSTHVLGYAGCALCDAGQGDRGKSILMRSLSIDDEHQESHAALGAQLLREGDVDAAIAHLSRAIRTHPQDTKLAVWRSILALAHLIKGDVARARAEVEQAITADDRTHMSRVVLTAICLAEDNPEAARVAWADGVRVTPDLTPDLVAPLVGQRVAQAIGDLA
jgi:DNA-binding winged helix-turn-helix (wHTH) protein/Tfp pilus assembly protein PilF